MHVNRDRYLKKLISHAWNGQIKVITGVRRCGKSYLLNTIYQEHLKSTGVADDCIIAIALDSNTYTKYRNPLELVDYVVEKTQDSDKKYYVFIDEIQMSDEVNNPFNADGKKITFYDALNDIRQRKNIDCYVTGSNSKMLSTDILTEFRGRGDEIRVHPLSFSEFVNASKDDVNVAFDEYCMYGGMPFVLSISDDDDKEKYLKDLFSKVYISDIVERKKIKRLDILGMIIDVLCSSIGSLTNPKKIFNTLMTKYDKNISLNLVYRYIDDIKDCFLFEECKRYDIKGKAYFDYPNKYYCEDVGLRNARLNFRQLEKTHIMENIIFNELRIRGFAVDIGEVGYLEKNKNGNPTTKFKEVDFIATKGSRKYYIQSAYAIDNEEKMNDEKNHLKMIPDSFSKIIVRRDVGKRWYDDDGILNINIIDFLTDESLMS